MMRTSLISLGTTLLVMASDAPPTQPVSLLARNNLSAVVVR
jgi:hypothetical protein